MHVNARGSKIDKLWQINEMTFGTGLMVMVTGVLIDLPTEAKAGITILVSMKPFFVGFVYCKPHITSRLLDFELVLWLLQISYCMP